MSTARSDVYSAPSNTTTIAGGITLYAQPDLVGGTVNSLLSSWSGTGFRLLSTLPSSGAFTVHPHGASSWDEARRILWIFGAETHGTTSGMNNAVYRFDLSDGYIKRMYSPSPWPGEYRVGTDSVLWADAAHTKPWAMHSYRRQRFIPETKEIEICYDAADHAQWFDAIKEGTPTMWDGIGSMWYYNTVTGTWRVETGGSRAQFVKQTTASAIGYVPGYGWYQADQTWVYHLRENLTFEYFNLLGKLTDNYHDAYYIVGSGNNELLKFGGHANNWLWSRMPLTNTSATTRKAQSEYAVLTNHTTAQLPSVQMPDGRILFFPLRTTDYVFRPMIYDPVSDTIIETGHELALGGTSWTYEFKIAWSVADNCAIWLSHSLGQKVYAYRPPVGI